ncbi:hypothetical protein SEVIR_9G283742v4 [Setaria viridis]
MDPNVINEGNVRDKLNRTLKNIYNFLDKQHYKKYILLPYNFNFHWILLVIVIDRSMVYILNSLRRPINQYTDLIDMFNIAWARFHQHHSGEFKEQLHINSKFLCLRQNSGNNLCGYYVCEFIHGFVRPKRITDHEFRIVHMKEEFLETEKNQGDLRTI